MKKLNDILEGILDSNYDVQANELQQYLLQYVNPDSAGSDFMKLKWDDPKRFDVVSAVLEHIKTYPTISSTEAKKRIKAGDTNVVGVRDSGGMFSEIFDIYMFNCDKDCWTHRIPQASKHLHIVAILCDTEKRWQSHLDIAQKPCNSISRDIETFYDVSM